MTGKFCLGQTGANNALGRPSYNEPLGESPLAGRICQTAQSPLSGGGNLAEEIAPSSALETSIEVTGRIIICAASVIPP